MSGPGSKPARFWSLAKTVFSKEMIDALRDRRSLMSALAFPLFGPLLIAVMFNTLARSERKVEIIELPVAGAELAPSLVGFLEGHGIEIDDPPDDPEDAVRRGDVDMVLVISEEYPEAFRRADPAEVSLIVDGSRRSAATSIRRTTDLLQLYNAQVANLRLLAHGVSPAVSRPLDLERVDVASRKKRAARLALSVIPMFLILASFISGVNVAIDTTAGERERRSLEPLLVNPVPRLAVVYGKWGTTVLFGLVGVVLTAFFSILALRYASLEDLGIQINVGGLEFVALLAGAAPVAFLAAGLQMFVATFARSYKEAQTYVAILPFAAMMPAILLQFQPLDTAAWMMAVPSMAQEQLLLDTLGGEIHWPFIGLAAIACLLYSLLSVWVTARMLRRERIVFGG
jgi:sodium transport system permease protein